MGVYVRPTLHLTCTIVLRMRWLRNPKRVWVCVDALEQRHERLGETHDDEQKAIEHALCVLFCMRHVVRATGMRMDSVDMRWLDVDFGRCRRGRLRRLTSWVVWADGAAAAAYESGCCVMFLLTMHERSVVGRWSDGHAQCDSLRRYVHHVQHSDCVHVSFNAFSDRSGAGFRKHSKTLANVGFSDELCPVIPWKS